MKRMMKKKIIFCAVMAMTALFFSYAAHAESTSDNAARWNGTNGAGTPAIQKSGRPHHPPGPFMRVLDTDRDGQLSAAEIANAPQALLTLDKNGDGMLGRDELRPKWPGRSRRGPQDNGSSYPGRNDGTSE